MNRIRTELGRGIRLRMGLLCGVLALGMGLVVSAGWDIMVEDGQNWRDLAEDQRGLVEALIADGRPLLKLSGIALIASGLDL